MKTFIYESHGLRICSTKKINRNIKTILQIYRNNQTIVKKNKEKYKERQREIQIQMKRNTANGKGYVGQVGGVGMAGKDSSGDNKPNKLPLTNVSLGSGDHHDDDVFFCRL